jgi:hypothetical protein
LTSSFTLANQTNSKVPTAPGEDASKNAQRCKNPIASATPMRRRSWPQIHRMLEFESAQKEKPPAEPLPPARV